MQMQDESIQTFPIVDRFFTDGCIELDEPGTHE
jgi:hypothetical protein